MVIGKRKMRKTMGNRNPFPPKLENGTEVDLFDLYMSVQKEGGNRKTSRENKWALLAVELGFNWDVGSNLRIIYVKYLDLLEWYYEVMTKKMHMDEEDDLQKEEIDPKNDEDESLEDYIRVDEEVLEEEESLGQEVER
ncbi:hypothetical protein L1987_08276 [Smallanthus sonchifolius]|uniref:Uncharacterized protein n=1 Tax=Smallanthus sonchifolius TaxID=185202 RepID=A0ACB9JM24_9ASTR|nr:hypothetical protein L1987_08276 [Smallanthus sonchifolius]